MAFLKSLNRYMERNQAASKALLEQFEQSTIVDFDEFNNDLWVAIAASSNKKNVLEIEYDERTSLEFVVKMLTKIGFSCEDAVRLMMASYREGRVELARAEKDVLLGLKKYINAQARNHKVGLNCNIKNFD